MSENFKAANELLLGDRPTRQEVEQAARLFELASSEGEAEASERLAMFEAFGMARSQSWDRAFDYLELAARQGSARAREQLLLLADNQHYTDDVESDRSWAEVRARIGLARLIAPGEKTSLSDSPRIRAIKGFASAAECEWLICHARDRLAPATVFDQATGTQIAHPTRDNSYLLLRISEMNVVTEVLRHRISAATRLPVPIFEPSQLLHYSVGQRFRPHHDFLDPSNPAYAQELAHFGQRIATFLIYLNEGYSGGETQFPAIGLNYRAQAGDALFFANVTPEGAPDPRTLHAGLPPLLGEKWVFSQWIRDRFPAAA